MEPNRQNHEWNNEVNSFITISLGFTRCISDTCVYVKISKSGNVMIIEIFVDDIIPKLLKMKQNGVSIRLKYPINIQSKM